METQSPFSWWVQQAQALASRIQPPAWLIDEGQQRVVLLINHVLMQEPQACERLRRVAGQRVEVRWRQFNFCVVFTPAGLIDKQKPPIHIEGDVQLAAEINWLIDHVRWDLEEDLSRVMGDARAHVVMGVARQVAQALRQWMARPGAAPGGRSGSQVGFP